MVEAGKFSRQGDENENNMNTVVSTLIYLAALVLMLVYRALFGIFLWTADRLAEAGKTFRKENLL